MNRLTQLLFLASFIMLGLIEEMRINNLSNELRNCRKGLQHKDSLINEANAKLMQADSVFQTIPEYFPSKQVFEAYFD